ncbi:MAG: Rieske 2Fe-2S domain-containing protein [Rubrivivax sp.]|nr:Rieske 2Fe-2S domain-containing protein [Rubrivivax sp.]
MKTIPITVDTGTAYGRPPPQHNAALTEVGAGTPMGELLRRYWHPVGLAADAGAVPRQLRVLGEDLILFRDGAGRPGLVHPRCAHRGSSLYYGKVEERGIRCCYHGWLFDVQGHCLEQPCEPQGGERARGKVRQPWYPVEERYGLVWAYLGPPDRKPVLPRYDALETLDEGEFLEADDHSIGGGGPPVIPCNWLQHYDNLVDPFHVVILHASFSGTQFVEQMALMPQVSWETTALGVKTVSLRQLPDGNTLHRVSEAAVPTLRVIPSPRIGRYGRVESIGWVLPMDDTHFRIYVVGRVKEAGELVRMRSRLNGKLWEELSEAEHQAYPGDYEAQVSQGAIAAHSEEHLATSDRGIVMLRRFLQRQLDAVAAGQDPAGVSRDPEAPPVVFEAGNYLRQP